jgi:flagellar biosynthesis/type III secretory pathway M-ring protein FliF/YscJ
MRKNRITDFILYKIPFGIVAGASAIVVFYAVLGFVAAYVLFSAIAQQTAEVVTPFQYGWQSAIFGAIIVFSLIFLGALTMFILKKTLFKSRVAAYMQAKNTPPEGIETEQAETDAAPETAETGSEPDASGEQAEEITADVPGEQAEEIAAEETDAADQTTQSGGQTV